ncbi:acyltransferase [Amorphoplanes digitatis]|uniref:acyltransferase family protein n=1 Tax=Actinoplanes digitatis TaxID=1868 RepID=UPI0016198A55|nr:acyltransferase [Actinoplanes digitatis]GID94201.1 integral membrane transferase [Actinoplanes digitatis]
MTEGTPSGRDRYFDTLRTLAIVRVVVFHAFPIAALELVFPSMAVMFALGGSLMVKSLDRAEVQAVRNRLRRLLPALWVMALIVVPLMIRDGWPDRPSWPHMLLWVFPIADPPSSEYGSPAAGVLWYLVTYLWLVLLSPLLLRLYRRWNLPTVLLPLVGLMLLMAYRDMFGDTVAWVAHNVLMFGACWVLGFAHREGDLAKLRPATVLGVAAACVGGGLGWAYLHPGEEGFDLTGRPVAYAIFSVGFVLALLRWTPRMDWLARIRPLDGLVSMVNNRAVTIYLWHNVAITVAIALYDPLELWKLPTQGFQTAVDFSIAIALIGVAVLVLGWVEDLAARRRPRLSPFVRRREPARPAVAAPEPVPAAH